MPVKQWKLLSARLRCPHCGNTIYMVYKGRWSIHKASSTLDRVTPQSPLSMSPEDASEKDEGQVHSDG